MNGDPKHTTGEYTVYEAEHRRRSSTLENDRYENRNPRGDDADPDARNVVDLLDGIPSAYERAQLGLAQANAGETVTLDEL